MIYHDQAPRWTRIFAASYLVAFALLILAAKLQGTCRIPVSGQLNIPNEAGQLVAHSIHFCAQWSDVRPIYPFLFSGLAAFLSWAIGSAAAKWIQSKPRRLIVNLMVVTAAALATFAWMAALWIRLYPHDFHWF